MSAFDQWLATIGDDDKDFIAGAASAWIAATERMAGVVPLSCSLREYFAAQIMPVLVPSHDATNILSFNPAPFAMQAVLCADALLEALKRPAGKEAKP